MTDALKADRFRALHVRGAPVVLYNIWDAGSAKAVAEAGAAALATGSWSVAAAQGYPDGECLPMDLLLSVVGRIAATVDLPLSVDFESAYAVEPAGVAANVARVMAAGAIGINFEDGIPGSADIRPLPLQVQRIAAARTAGAFFLNARTDLFLTVPAERHAGLLAEAVERGHAFAEAGADGFFVPGIASRDLLARVCEDVPLPVNAMMTGVLGPAPTLGETGVARISYGPAPYRLTMAELTARARDLYGN
ncbi:MAG: isocitrate lyase/phosphoenolpyruvate mutase family protein [Rhodobacteraceae bacterium]|jgi:2-methylisocitrate lyase-like PEP mutase family enzyme|nr:isocitrate lyase/phosphoenolpyruvate mutase family protein [Paracoccaceae bacterium]